MLSDTNAPKRISPNGAAEPVSDADALSRREFFTTVGKTLGGIALVGAAAQALPAAAQEAGKALVAKVKPVQAETMVKTLYGSLTPKQRENLCKPWDNPLRSKVGANWFIVPQKIRELSADQKEMVNGILRGVTTEEWYPQILKQMDGDGGGIDNYTIAMFGDPTTSKFEWVITGRHVTLRADGHSNANAAFGGPIFYGHAPKDTEDKGHPGNIYWKQGEKANAVLAALDPKQRDIALLDKAPSEDTIKLQGARGMFPGIAIGELSKDQKKLVEETMHSLLSPYRPSDAADVMRDISANGGLDQIHLSFYKQDALGEPGIWDIWRLEGPSLVWHFRGAPHVHTWVNVAKDAKIADAHT